MSKFRQYDKYEVFEDSRIWSYKSNKWLKHITDTNGYQKVQLFDNEGNGKWYKVHRVVYEAVTGEPIPSDMEINHRSEVKTENMISNLELVSHKENINYGSRTERAKKSNINNPKKSKQVGAFKNGELLMSFPSTAEAHRNGFNSSAVSACCRNCFHREGNNVYKGYTWKYL